MRRGLIFGAIVFLAASARGQDATLPFTISLEEITIPKVPALQSFSWATTTGGQWLILGGRTGGLHGKQDSGTTPPPRSNFVDFNDKIFLIDPAKKTVISRPIGDLVPKAIAASLTVTASQSVQVGDRLVLVGGYGYDAEKQFLMTYPTLTVIDIEATASAIANGGPIGNHIRQSKSDESLRVTGGDLAYSDGVYRIVFGQNFAGFYTPLSNGNYTFQVRSFHLVDADGTVILAKKSAVGSPADTEFRRRDGNLVPIIQGDGSRSWIYYGGVFTPQKGPWSRPVEIRPEGAVIDPTGFPQQMCSYHCPTISLFSGSTKTMTTLFFGGISEVVPTATGFGKDLQMPFISGVGAIVRSGESSAEFLVCQGGKGPAKALQMPALLGASAEFLPVPSTLFDDNVLRLDRLKGDTIVGHIYGGILATKPDGGPTRASSRIFAVHLTPAPSLTIPVKLKP